MTISKYKESYKPVQHIASNTRNSRVKDQGLAWKLDTMPFLDLFIRPEGSPPPLQQPFVLGNRMSCLLLVQTIVILAAYMHYLRVYKLSGFVMHLAIGMILSVLEALVSNSFGLDILNLRQAGYGDATILLYMEFTRLSSQFLAYILVNYVVTDDNVYSFQYLVSSVNLVSLTKIGINLTLAELLFTAGHSLMHKSPWLMKLHVFHHCCTRPNWNTNLLFHPVDIAIEFTTPALSLFAMHWFVWQDDFILLYTYIVFQLWYAYDHDTNMQLYHAQHHIHCDSLYTIYCNVRGTPALNLLKKHMNDNGLLGKETGGSKDR